MTENKPRELGPYDPNIIATPENHSMARIFRVLLVSSLWVVSIPWLLFTKGADERDRTDTLYGHVFMVILGLAIAYGGGVVAGIIYYLVGVAVTGYSYLYLRTDDNT